MNRPLRKKQRINMKVDKERLPPNSERRTLNVLLAEDDPADAAAIQRALQTALPDIQVRVAGTLAAYRQAVTDRPPDVTIMDLNLPDGCALEVLTSPAEAGPFPILIMTSYGNEQVAVEALKAGALDYVVKSPEAFFGMPHSVERAMREWNLLQARKQIDETLRKSEENFRRSLDDSPLGVRVVSAAGETIYANKVFLDIYGYSNVEELNKIPLKERYTPQSYAEFKKRRKIREEDKFGPTEYEIAIVRKNREIRHLQVFRKEVFWNDAKQFQTIYQDISERKRAEEKVRNSLAEKEVLLKEVHHRVKNNLMTIIGLIEMQETKANNEMFSPLLQELEGRIHAMALVHESLHKSEDLARIDLQNYIETMSSHIRAQFGAERDIRFSVRAAGVEADLDIAVSCGLILNEMITNAYKHAFPGDKPRAGEGKCEIAVAVKQEGGMLTLTVADNGIGLPAGLDWEKSETLGLRLIKMLSKQLNGTLEMERSSGTVFRLKFPMAVS